MAVTRTGNVVHMTASGTDSITGTVIVKGVVCDSAVTLTDGDDVVVFKSGGPTSATLGDGVYVQGLKFSAGTGTVTVYV